VNSSISNQRMTYSQIDLLSGLLKPGQRLFNLQAHRNQVPLLVLPPPMLFSQNHRS
jgi:hypothetical protein